MVQYSSCADPTESAARRERTRQAEEEGQFDEAAERMVRASLQVMSTDSPRFVSPEPIDSLERLPVAFRLGPISAPDPPQKPKKRTTSKKKLGRPPGRPPGKAKTRKGLLPSPSALIAGKGKKRKLLIAQPSPRRRLYLDPPQARATPSQAGPSFPVHQGQSPNPPPSARMDFQNPPKLLP